MDVTDHVRLRQGEKVAIVQQVLGRVLEAVPTDVGFLHTVGADGGAHRSIDDGDSIFEDLLQRMLMVVRHFSPVAVSMTTLGMSRQPYSAVLRLFYYNESVNVPACGGSGGLRRA
jgi:hypothetical protein